MKITMNPRISAVVWAITTLSRRVAGGDDPRPAEPYLNALGELLEEPALY